MVERAGDTVERAGDRNVQEAYDYYEGRSAFVIADVGTDGAWIAVPRGQEASVETCR
ncbi:hypothetical protein [Natronomonas sp. LN261]|jgi:hypothetical protein|uniref:DUF7556 family protein n=1 Tax=Natronomonas sp. LN261 TaxID=2750669 RepID=UPI0015EFA13E|nr:hypothetical protein [Natronomonas sp. LN261]